MARGSEQGGEKPGSSWGNRDGPTKLGMSNNDYEVVFHENTIYCGGLFNVRWLSIILMIICAEQRFYAKRTALLEKLCLKILLESLTHA